MFFLPGLFSIPRLTISIMMSVLMLGAFAYGGFVLYVTQVQPKSPDVVTDTVIVLTGGAGRVEAGFQILADKKAKSMLITGVHNKVKLTDLLRGGITKDDIRNTVLQHCCITLGYVAETTQDNAAEAADWFRENKIPQNATIRLVTSDYHMPRALIQFHRALPQAQIYPWPVKSNIDDKTFWHNVNYEFGKFILTWMSEQTAKTADKPNA